jgi:hypothetical protein
MSKRPLPNLPDRRPKASAGSSLPPGPSLTPSQQEEFDRSSEGMQRCHAELQRLDAEPDGGDPSRRAVVQAEMDEHTVAFEAICKLMALKLTVATEEELAPMNRAQRRDYEASMRKKKKAKGP